MNYRMISKILGRVMGVEAALMLGPIITAAVYGESAVSFLLTMLIAGVLAVVLTLPKLKHTDIYAREGFVSVALSWLLMSLVGALPFVFSGEIPSYVDAFFEIVSGFTTTGASIILNVEEMSSSVCSRISEPGQSSSASLTEVVMPLLPLVAKSAIRLPASLDEWACRKDCMVVAMEPCQMG